jgi:hypothetical protein
MAEIRWVPSRGWTGKLRRDGMLFQVTGVCSAPEAPWSVLGTVLPPEGIKDLDQLVALDPIELGDYGTEQEAQRVAERFLRNALPPQRLKELIDRFQRQPS